MYNMNIDLSYVRLFALLMSQFYDTRNFTNKNIFIDKKKWIQINCDWI